MDNHCCGSKMQYSHVYMGPPPPWLNMFASQSSAAEVLLAVASSGMYKAGLRVSAGPEVRAGFHAVFNTRLVPHCVALPHRCMWDVYSGAQSGSWSPCFVGRALL
jgi:hypothetical protein